MDGFKQTNASRLRPSDKGRPRIDDGDDWIIAHFVEGLRQGRSLTDIASNGLRLYGLESQPGGEPQLVVRRSLEPETLVQLPDGAPLPVVINHGLEVLVGGLFVEAARKLGLKTLLVIVHAGLSKLEEMRYSIAEN